METVRLSRLEPSIAAAMLAGCEHLDPCGMTTAQDIAPMVRGAECFAATNDAGGQAVYVVRVVNGVAWIEAMKGDGPTDHIKTLLPAIEAQAQGLRRVAFQTARRGLVRKAQRQGYTVAGWILSKGLA